MWKTGGRIQVLDNEPDLTLSKTPLWAGEGRRFTKQSSVREFRHGHS